MNDRILINEEKIGFLNIPLSVNKAYQNLPYTRGHNVFIPRENLFYLPENSISRLK